MNIIKKIIAATTSVLSVGVLSAASITAYADETTTTTEATETTTTETTTSETSTETSSDTTTSTTAPASYNMWLSCGGSAMQQESAVTVTANGTYTAQYKFTASDVASTVTSLVLESDINSEIAAGVKFKVTGLKLGTDEGSAKTIQYTNFADDVFGVNAESKCYYLNIIGTSADGAVKDLGVDAVTFDPKADDTVFVTFTVEGLADAGTTTSSTTTTTTTRTISYVGYGNNTGSSSNGKTTTNTVAQTADEGVVAIVVTAAAAVALAAGAMTIRKKRK